MTDSRIVINMRPSRLRRVLVTAPKGDLSVPAHSSARMLLQIKAASNVSDAEYNVPLRSFAAGQWMPIQRLKVVIAAKGNLLRYFDNSGITADEAQWAGDLDGSGATYSAQSLRSAGVTAGRLVGGIRWPAVPAGDPDNVVADGQRISMHGAAHASLLAFIGSASSGPSSGLVTLTYEDGSTIHQVLGFSDWTLSTGTGQPSFGNQIVAAVRYRNCTCDSTETRFALTPSEDGGESYLYLATVPLNPSKTLASVTLPTGADTGRLHVFALGTVNPRRKSVSNSIRIRVGPEQSRQLGPKTGMTK